MCFYLQINSYKQSNIMTKKSNKDKIWLIIITSWLMSKRNADRSMLLKKMPIKLWNYLANKLISMTGKSVLKFLVYTLKMHR